MPQTPQFTPKKVYDVAPGQAVVLILDGTPVLCMKADRPCKEFVRHYLFPVAPTPDDGPSLIYADPDDDVAACNGRIAFTLGGEQPGEGPVSVGTALRNAAGLWLKVTEHERFQGHKQVEFLELSKGEVKSRQDRKVESVFASWRADGVAIEQTTFSAEEVLKIFADQKSRSA